MKPRVVPVGVVLQEAEYPPLRSVECGHVGRYHCQLCHLHKINIHLEKVQLLAGLQLFSTVLRSKHNIQRHNIGTEEDILKNS